jgi:rsbT co-antagonist protein RsbR
VLSDTNFSLTRELETKLVTIERQAAAIRELSTPVMEIWDDVLVLPIVGVVDTKRSMEIMDNLLQRIVETQSRCVIIDVTGVEVVDTKTADYLLKVVRASNLLGTRCVLTGLSPAIAQTLVEIGADLTEVRTLRNLKAGLKDCLRFLRRSRADAGED